MDAISGNTIGGLSSGLRPGGVGKSGEDEELKSTSEKLRESLTPKDTVDISERARELAAAAREVREAQEEEQTTAEEKSIADDEAETGAWTIMEAIPDPDDPDNIAAATHRVVASGEGKTPGVYA
ncbi:MAG: hypothetical protein LUC93_00315 [Planctomycetaceae bacterium]|nr:hypothetical protein [Planctomycetaceae bacterium]